MNKTISDYFAKIGQKGGKASKGTPKKGMWENMTPEQRSERMRQIRKGKKPGV